MTDKGLLVISDGFAVLFAFEKFALLNFDFIKVPVSVFTNWKKSEEDFCFYEKSRKAKIAFLICFAVSLLEAAGTPRHPEWLHQLLPREFQCLQHLSIKSRHTSESCLWASVLCLNLPARRVLRKLVLPFTLFQLMKGFIGMLYFGIVGGEHVLALLILSLF